MIYDLLILDSIHLDGYYKTVQSSLYRRVTLGMFWAVYSYKNNISALVQNCLITKFL